MLIFSKKNPECIRKNFVIQAPFCRDQSEKLIFKTHLLKGQTFIPPVKNVQVFKLNFFIINNFLDQFRIYHRKGQVLNFKNISLSIFSIANSISYTGSKTGVFFMKVCSSVFDISTVTFIFVYFLWISQLARKKNYLNSK